MIELGVEEYIDESLLKGVSSISNSRMCGFIVYTRKHANVLKVLRDEDYWTELDVISGLNWPIFAIKPLECEHIGSNRKFSMLIPVGESFRMTKNILELFQLEDSDRDLPCFVLFSWNNHDEICFCTYKIDNGSVERAHESLREVVYAVSKAESLVWKEYKKGIGVYREASSSLNALEVSKRVKRMSRYLWHMMKRMVTFAKFFL